MGPKRQTDFSLRYLQQRAIVDRPLAAYGPFAGRIPDLRHEAPTVRYNVIFPILTRMTVVRRSNPIKQFDTGSLS